MAKVGVNIDVEISRVAAERDKLLRAISPALPIVRLERLQVALVQAYPVDTALKSIADERDRSLELGNGIPRSVELLLSNRLRLVTGARRAAPTSEPLVWRRRYKGLFPRPVQAVGAAAVILLAALLLMEWQTTRREDSRRFSDSSAEQPNSTQPAPDATTPSLSRTFFASSREHLSLQVTRLQLVAFQSSPLGINRSIFSDTQESDRTLPLDLPVRQIALDPDSLITPQ